MKRLAKIVNGFRRSLFSQNAVYDVVLVFLLLNLSLFHTFFLEFLLLYLNR